MGANTVRGRPGSFLSLPTSSCHIHPRESKPILKAQRDPLRRQLLHSNHTEGTLHRQPPPHYRHPPPCCPWPAIVGLSKDLSRGVSCQGLLSPSPGSHRPQFTQRQPRETSLICSRRRWMATAAICHPGQGRNDEKTPKCTISAGQLNACCVWNIPRDPSCLAPFLSGE